MAEKINQVCPYCGGGFEANESTVTCEYCGKIYHKGCWEINSGCATMECIGHDSITKPDFLEVETAQAQASEREAPEPETLTMKKCPVCGTEMDQSVVFCPGCGEKYDAEKESPQIYLGQTNSTLNQDPKKRKNSTLVIAIIAATVVLIGGISIFIISNNNYEKYVTQVNQFASDTLDASINLGVIGTEITSYWYDYIYNNDLYYGYYYWQYLTIYDSLDEAIAAAYNSVGTEVSQADKDYKNLTAQFEELKDPPFTFQETDALASKAIKLYRSYGNLNECVADVSGKNYSEFNSFFESALSGVLTDYEDLKEKLDDELE